MAQKLISQSFVIVIFSLFIIPFSVNAATWDPPSDSDMYWCDSFNWWLGFGPPTSADTVLINSTPDGPAIIDLNCSAETAFLIISQFGNSATVKVAPGGSLHVYGDTILGNYSQTGTLDVQGLVTIDSKLTVGYYIAPRGIGAVNLAGGTIEVGGDVIVGEQGGDGTITITAGVLDIAGELDMLNGHVQVNGGIVYADDLFFFPPHGTFDITGDGTVVVRQDLSNFIGHSIDSITACGGQGEVIIEYYTGITVARTECVCPNSDLNGDCYVNLEDLAILAEQWLTGAQ